MDLFLARSCYCKLPRGSASRKPQAAMMTWSVAWHGDLRPAPLRHRSLALARTPLAGARTDTAWPAPALRPPRRSRAPPPRPSAGAVDGQPGSQLRHGHPALVFEQVLHIHGRRLIRTEPDGTTGLRQPSIYQVQVDLGDQVLRVGPRKMWPQRCAQRLQPHKIWLASRKVRTRA